MSLGNQAEMLGLHPGQSLVLEIEVHELSRVPALLDQIRSNLVKETRLARSPHADHHLRLAGKSGKFGVAPRQRKQRSLKPREDLLLNNSLYLVFQ